MLESFALTLLLAGSASQETTVPQNVRDCAVTIFRPVTARYVSSESANEAASWIHIQPLSGSPWSALPFTAYRAEFTLPRPGVAAWLAADQGRCTLLRGDLRDVVGVSADFEAERAYALVQFNDVVGRLASTNGMESDEAAISYVGAVLSLVTASPRSLVVRSIADVPMTKSAHDASGGSTARIALDVPIRAPRVTRGGKLLRIDLDTWEDVGGIVWRNTIFVFPDGRLAASRTSLATQVGDFKVARVRM